MPTDAAVFVFGAYALDLIRGELRKDGQPIKLAPQPFKALQLLISRPGILITRDELRQSLWGEDRFVDFNAGLNFCIGQLRAALDDPATRSAIIVTVPRRGYRFVAEVRRQVPAGAGDRVSAVAVAEAAFRPVASPLSARSRQWWTAAAAFAFVALLTLAPAGDRLPVRVPASRSLVALKEYELGASGLADASPRDLLVRARRIESAIAADPTFVEAFVALADAQLIIGNYRIAPPQIAYASAKAAAMKAISLDPSFADAHALYAASLLYLDWDWGKAAVHFARADLRASISPRVHQWYSRYLSASGRHAEALRHARRATSLAPRSISAMTDLGNAAFQSGQLDQAQTICGEAAALMPEFLPARWCAAGAAAEAGRFDVAASYGMPNPGDAAAFWDARASRLLHAAGTDDEHVRRSVAIAVALAHSGRSSEAIDWLERGANARIDDMLFVRTHPAFQGLSAESRFLRVLQHIGP